MITFYYILKTVTLFKHLIQFSMLMKYKNIWLPMKGEETLFSFESVT